MPESEQAAAIGASNYRLLKSGLAKWEDIVTPNRVRDFREVVARNKLTVDQMVKHGVKKYQAEKAYADVHTTEHERIERQRRELIEKITAAGVSHDKLIEELSKRLAGRVTIAPGPTGAQVGRPQDTGGPAWSGGGLPGTGPSSAGELAKLISGWKPPRAPVKPKPGPAGQAPAPEPAENPPVGKVFTEHEFGQSDARSSFEVGAAYRRDDIRPQNHQAQIASVRGAWTARRSGSRRATTVRSW